MRTVWVEVDEGLIGFITKSQLSPGVTRRTGAARSGGYENVSAGMKKIDLTVNWGTETRC